MTAIIQRISGPELYSLISFEEIGIVEEKDRLIMDQYLQKSSVVWLGSHEGKILGFWGLVAPTLISDCAYLWLYTTPSLVEHSFVFIRHSQKVIEESLKHYPIIVGHCVKGQAKSIRWLKWLGAKFGKVENGLIPFEIRAA